MSAVCRFVLPRHETLRPNETLDSPTCKIKNNPNETRPSAPPPSALCPQPCNPLPLNVKGVPHPVQVLGTRVVPATHGQKTLKEAVDSAFGAYMGDPETMLFAIGSTVGPHPYPGLVRDFQAIVGYEAKDQFQEQVGKLPDIMVACVGGGCNSLGLFTAFLDEPGVKLVGVEPAGLGLDKGEGNHSATLTLGKPGVMHGFNSIMLADDKGEPASVYSCASGLDYPSVGPQHAFMFEHGRVEYTTATDQQVIDCFFELSRMEGIIPALESAHGLAHAIKLAPTLGKDVIICVNLSGRGDKDLDYVCDKYGKRYAPPNPPSLPASPSCALSSHATQTRFDGPNAISVFPLCPCSENAPASTPPLHVILTLLAVFGEFFLAIFLRGVPLPLLTALLLSLPRFPTVYT